MRRNAAIKKNPIRKQALPRIDRTRHCGIAKRVLIIAVLVMIVALPVTGSISITDVTRSPRVETVHLNYLESICSLPHLPHSTDSLLDAWGDHQRNRHAVSVFW
jgi:hypothetical protein